MSGDQILSVNGQDVFGYSHSSVLDILQSVKKQPDKPVKLVVSRSTATNEDEADNSFSDIDVSGRLWVGLELNIFAIFTSIFFRLFFSLHHLILRWSKLI